MALPSIMRKLFRNDGYGPLLKDEIVSKYISVQDWSNAYDYPVATVVRGGDGVLYYSVQASGPGTAAGYKDPVADDGTYWGSVLTKSPAQNDNSSKIATTEWVNNRISGFVFGISHIYIDGVNGSDDNDGLTQQTPIKTSVKFHSILSKTSFSGNPIIVHISASDYSSDSNIFVFQSITPKLVLYFETGSIVDSIFAGANCAIYIIGSVQVKFRIAAASNGSIIFGYGAGSAVSISFVNVNTLSLIRADSGGLIDRYWDSIVSLTFTNCKVSTGTFRVATGGVISHGGSSSTPYTITGTVTGKRYTAIELGGIFGFGSPTAIPGSSDGSTSSGGQYT